MGNNSFKKIAIKLFIRVLGLDICCFITSMFTVSITNSQILRVLIQLACIVGTVSFVYPVCYSAGDLDSPLVSAGHKKYSPLKGLWLGFTATSPLLLSSIVLIISRVSGIIPTFANYFKIFNSFYFPFLYTILPVDYSITEISYGNIFLGASVVLIIPLICMFAYMLGLSRFSFNEKILYKKKTSE